MGFRLFLPPNHARGFPNCKACHFSLRKTLYANDFPSIRFPRNQDFPRSEKRQNHLRVILGRWLLPGLLSVAGVIQCWRRGVLLYNAPKRRHARSLLRKPVSRLFWEGEVRRVWRTRRPKAFAFRQGLENSETEISMGQGVVGESVPVITIDGPGGAGKGVVSRSLAARLGWRLLDSGALYRLLALDAVSRGIDLEDEPALSSLGRGLDCGFGPGENEERILLNGREVTREIRSETCGNDASRIASLPGVREALLKRQRNFREPPGLVADGRDMGISVFPDARVKIFLTATPDERARRRYHQLKEQGTDVNLASLLTELSERDKRDRGRLASPLRPAADAVLIDTTGLGIDAVLDRVTRIANEHGERDGGVII
uniref:Cytidylate kinase n=1 Tax=Candidatus Kentrum sp. SD TaxID=2126332 RepID=A0A451BI62_9GAMM|nr:MAG: cytidylate kinase [Candidatus Kentron sp. SD]